MLLVDVGRRVPKLRNACQLVRHRHRWRHQIELPLHGLLQNHVDGQHAVDLVGAFEDAVDAGIAVGVLGTGLRAVAHASVHLHRFVDHVVRHLGAEDLHHGALWGEGRDAFQRRFSLVHAAGCEVGDGVVDVLGGAVHGRFQGVRLDGHLAELVANCPVFADGTSKLFPRIRVLHAFRDGVLAGPDDDPTELDTPNVEDVHGNLEALAALVEEVFSGHLHVVEEELAGA